MLFLSSPTWSLLLSITCLLDTCNGGNSNSYDDEDDVIQDIYFDKCGCWAWWYIFTGGLPAPAQHCLQLRLPPSVRTLLFNFKMDTTPCEGRGDYLPTQKVGGHTIQAKPSKIIFFFSQMLQHQLLIDTKILCLHFVIGYIVTTSEKYFSQLAKIVSRKECSKFKTLQHLTNINTEKIGFI